MPTRKPTATGTGRSRKSTRRAGSQKKSEPRVRVRMYRQGLGDCFLVKLPAASGRTFTLLIDCGVVLGTKGADQRMHDVVADVLEETQGHLDLLVATHEHWDHVSGFSQARDLFDKIDCEQVWVAWTEDPNDAVATKLRAERRRAENALRMAGNHPAFAGTETSQRVASLVGFFGASAGSTEDALAYVKKRGKGKPRYLAPGEAPISLPELPGIRFWVLGPPRNESQLKKTNPGQREGYGLDAGAGGAQSLLVAGLTRGMGAASGDETVEEGPIEEPFEAIYSIPLARAQHLEFFERRYFGEVVDGSLYDKVAQNESRDQSWRRIDATWMDAAEAMALQLDAATNNTSLVLAIELETGEVLLFPGDAQAGNLLSWQDLKWELEAAGAGKKTTVTAADLLARTVCYKVGHHGSHNATLKAKGLELMADDNLMALVPVDHEMAVKKRWGRIPFPELLDRIHEKTHGRMLRSDDKVSSNDDLAKLKPRNADDEEWRRFTERIEATKLYYEVEF
jgi:beta-lactamase superfamily II metal-dependent hydrolase